MNSKAQNTGIPMKNRRVNLDLRVIDETAVVRVVFSMIVARDQSLSSDRNHPPQGAVDSAFFSGQYEEFRQHARKLLSSK